MCGQIRSNLYSRSPRIRRHTRSYTFFYSASSALTPSTTSQRLSVDTTGNSRIPNFGTINNPHLTHTGLSSHVQGGGHVFMLIRFKGLLHVCQYGKPQ